MFYLEKNSVVACRNKLLLNTSMSDIKSVISLLCKHFKILLNVNIQPEHLRLAKFNSNEETTVYQLWHILYQVCNEEMNSSFKFYEDNVVNFVKLHFARLKYDSIEFYCLPLDMSSGSRELILALSWLMAVESILEKMTRKKVMEAPINMEFGYEIPKEAPSTATRSQVHHFGSKEEELNYILWAAGKIRHNVNAIAEADQERIRLVTQLHQASANVCGLPHLSVADTRLVRDPQLLASTLAALKDIVSLIDTHKQWSKKSSVFWDWMGTVLAEKEKSNKASGISGSEKKALISFVNTIRRTTKSHLFDRKSLVTMSCDDSCDWKHALPRFILQGKGKDTELEKWLSDTNSQLEELQKEFRIKEMDLQSQLSNLAQQMPNIILLPSRKRQIPKLKLK